MADDGFPYQSEDGEDIYRGRIGVSGTVDTPHVVRRGQRVVTVSVGEVVEVAHKMHSGQLVRQQKIKHDEVYVSEAEGTLADVLAQLRDEDRKAQEDLEGKVPLPFDDDDWDDAPEGGEEAAG